MDFRNTGDITVNLGPLDRITAQMQPKINLLLDKAATDITAGAVRRTPPRVDTGAMQNGWTWRKDAAFSRMIYNPIEYTVYNELGTVKMAAHPMLGPSVEEERPKLTAAWAALFRP